MEDERRLVILPAYRVLAQTFDEEVQRRKKFYQLIGQKNDDYDILKLPNDVLQMRYKYIKNPSLMFAVLRVAIRRIIEGKDFLTFLETCRRYPVSLKGLSDDFNRDLVYVFKKEFMNKVANGSYFRELGILKTI